MNTLLIYPYFLEDRLHVEEIAAVPMGLYYVGAMLKANGHPVEILNWYGMRDRPEAIRHVLEERRPDIIGFSIVHANRWGAIDIARTAKSLNPETRIVLGGIGATFLWRHLLTHFKEIDYVVTGEGEYTFLHLMEAIQYGEDPARIGTIGGLARRGEQGPVVTAPAKPIADLDSLPQPARFFDFQHVALTRGCPGRCTFCGSPRFWGRQVRSHSAAYFVDQLELLARRGTNFFFVSDDTFTLNRRLVIAVCREIIQRGLTITWQAISKVNAVSADMIYWMRKAGCMQISYGVESGSPAIRRTLCKDIDEDQIRRAFELTTAHGILARAYFIYGAPGESAETVEESLALIDRIKPLSAIFYILDIFPGTALYEEYCRRTGVDDDIWLQRIEDILYFETDPRLNAGNVRAFGRRLRSGFARRLPEFALNIQLRQDPSLAADQADFLSRLGLTFSHGDYAGLDCRPGPVEVALRLFERARALHPDHRAFWGLALVYQRMGDRLRSREILQEGLGHFPTSPNLSIGMATVLMQDAQFRQALDHLLPFEASTEARPYIVQCYRNLGEHKKAADYLERMHKGNAS
jgi:anaerobic magnesium-protoporphyrin IX monomethyl ester cyclase